MSSVLVRFNVEIERLTLFILQLGGVSDTGAIWPEVRAVAGVVAGTKQWDKLKSMQQRVWLNWVSLEGGRIVFDVTAETPRVK